MRRSLLVTVVGACACIVDVPPDPQGPCDRVACSVDGFCDAGECRCQPGYVGDPYALHGCQSLVPQPHCQTTCGLNAYCEDAACRCADGFVAVCGTGDCIEEAVLCDGTEDCTNAIDEDPTVCAPAEVQEWIAIDDCDDGLDFQWRLWAQDRDWVWPSAESHFVSSGLGVESSELIDCARGELICFGATAGDHEWGVSLGGGRTCDDCCFACDDGIIDLGRKTCG